jgi:hypothetical protein
MQLTVGEVVLESSMALTDGYDAVENVRECHVGEVSKDLDVGRRHSQRGRQLGDETNSQLVRRVDVMAASGSGERALWRQMEAMVASFYSADEGYGMVSQTGLQR